MPSALVRRTLLGALALSATLAAAGGMRFSAFRPCDGNGAICAPQIYANGEIEVDSAKKLAAFLASKEAAESYLPTAPTVAFNSIGGSLAGGVLLGDFIRKKNMSTTLAPLYQRVNDNHEVTIFGKGAL